MFRIQCLSTQTLDIEPYFSIACLTWSNRVIPALQMLSFHFITTLFQWLSLLSMVPCTLVQQGEGRFVQKLVFSATSLNNGSVSPYSTSRVVETPPHEPSQDSLLPMTPALPHDSVPPVAQPPPSDPTFLVVESPFHCPTPPVFESSLHGSTPPVVETSSHDSTPSKVMQGNVWLLMV